MKKITNILICFVLVVISFSCTDQSTFNNPSHHQLENGAYIRFETAPPTDFMPENAQSISISEQIFDPNGNASQYDLSVNAQIVSTGETYNAENFITITSFPATLNITSQMIADAIGVDTSTFGAGDLITFTATVTRNDGVKFYGVEPSFNADNGTVGLGNTQNNLLTSPSYNNAMLFSYVLACPLDTTNTIYTGKYMLSNTIDAGGGCFGPFFFDQEVELTALSVYQRTFDAIYLEQFGFGNTSTYTIDFICGAVTFASSQGTGLGCSGGLILTSSTMPGPYSETDDSVLTVKLVEDCSGCGGAPDSEVELVLTKL